MKRAYPTGPWLALLAIGAAATLPDEALAARWQRVGNKTAGIELDSASIDRSSDGKIRAWHRETFSPPRLQDAWAFSYTSLLQFTEYQCAKRQITVLRRVYRAASGEELKSERFDAGEATPVLPDSATEAVLNHLCRPLPTVKADSALVPAPAPVAPPETAAGKKRKGKEAPPPPPSKPAAPWAYEGKLGPDKWATLDPAYALCGNGKRQSPIDIRQAIRGDLAPIRFTYPPVPLQLLDDGHGIVASATAGSMAVDGEEYDLQAIRFRLPGEEMVDGKRAPMGIQFEHRAKSGRIAVLAIPVQAGKEPHRGIRALWTALPLERQQVSAPADAKLDPMQLLPAKRDYFTYSGSLTYPPCSEGVLWLVLKQPIQLSREQIDDYARIYRNNVRPVQPANGRVVKVSR